MKTERLGTAERQQRLCSHFSCHFDRHATRVEARSKLELQNRDPKVHGESAGKCAVSQGHMDRTRESSMFQSGVTFKKYLVKQND